MKIKLIYKQINQHQLYKKLQDNNLTAKFLTFYYVLTVSPNY